MSFAKFFRSERWPILLLGIYVVVWAVLAVGPTYRDSWWLENIGVFCAIPLLIWSYRYFRLSNLSYTLIFAFLCLHSVGAHYTYAEVPFGEWMKTFFGFQRNHFDRLVHFSFGLLIAYPVREVFFRIAHTRGIWGYWLPVELTLALSALFEIGEWLVVVFTNPEAGAAYLGTQGDEFDPIKDMLVAGIGAIIAMAVTYAVRLQYDRWLPTRVKRSLAVTDSEPLGEVALDELKKRERKAARKKKRR